jgi:hypothetical protein
VSYRTLFGVPVGEGEWDGQDITLSYSHGLIMLVGLVFLAAEAALVGLWG